MMENGLWTHIQGDAFFCQARTRLHGKHILKSEDADLLPSNWQIP